MKPQFFATPAQLRAWLAAHHAGEKELLVGFYKRGSGKPSISWPESVDEALCFGWINGVRKNVDEQAYSIRFTPRKPTSIWSAINVAKVAKLEELGKMTAAGRRAFAARTPERTGVYSFERDTAAQLTPEQEQKLRANATAAAFFDAQPPWYRRTATHWVISAKREETRARRLDQLLRDSAQGRTLAQLTRPSAKPTTKKASGVGAKPPRTKRSAKKPPRVPKRRVAL
ncbi:MAG: YdeI/OmpD-associated family protein [Deltaproteobacteria bacterium]